MKKIILFASVISFAFLMSSCEEGKKDGLIKINNEKVKKVKKKIKKAGKKVNKELKDVVEEVKDGAEDVKEAF